MRTIPDLMTEYTYRFRRTHFSASQPWNCTIVKIKYPLSVQVHTHGIHQMDSFLIAQMREILLRDIDIHVLIHQLRTTCNQ